MRTKLTIDEFLEYTLVMLITAAVVMIGNWISSEFSVTLLESIPGILILLGIAILGTTLSKVMPGNIPGIIYITFIGIFLAVEISPTAAYVNEMVGKIGLLPLATPVLAYAGVNIGKDWAEFKKMGWRGILVTLCVVVGTFIGSAVIAQIILSAQGLI